MTTVDSISPLGSTGMGSTGMGSAGMGSAGLVVEGLTKRFDGRFDGRFGGEPVLCGVDLTVQHGASLALLGPSGCGKTTLLRTIAGLERPDGGRVTLGAETVADEITHVPPERRRIGMVFQDWALFPHLDVRRNVGYGLDGDRARHQEIVDRTLDMVGLAGLGNRMPSVLSGGQQQRVAIARAIAPGPAALLLDEPFSNLDAGLRVTVRSETRRLLGELGITTLFVTHDQEEAFVFGDEVAVMTEGVIRQQATPAALYTRPVDPWVAAFVGEANLLDAEAEGIGAQTVLGTIPLATPANGPHTVLARPEQIELSPGSTAEVVRVEFYGHDSSYRVAIAGTEIVARVAAAPVFGVGDRVDLAYRGPAVVAYPVAAVDTRSA